MMQMYTNLSTRMADTDQKSKDSFEILKLMEEVTD